MTHYDDGKETFRCEHGKVRGIEDEARRCKVCDPITPATLTSAEPPQELFLCPNCDQGHNEMAHEPPCPLARVSAPTSSSSAGIAALVAKWREYVEQEDNDQWGRERASTRADDIEDLEALAAALTAERTRMEAERETDMCAEHRANGGDLLVRAEAAEVARDVALASRHSLEEQLMAQRELAVKIYQRRAPRETTGERGVDD